MPTAIMAVLGPLAKGLGSVALSMLATLLTGPVLKRLVLKYLSSEADKYALRAAETEDKQDDRTAAMFVGVVSDLEDAWFPEKASK